MRACNQPVRRTAVRVGTVGLAGAIFLLHAMVGAVEAQSLIHRYSFKGNANDSVGTAHGAVVGNVTFQVDPNAVNGTAVFAGGTSAATPGYIRLPISAVNSLQNATLEIFTTSMAMPSDQYGQPNGQFQALFVEASPYANTTNYLILSPNRAGAGIGVGARRSGFTESVLVAPDPLPVWVQNHVVHLVYSGFSGVGTTGIVAIYLDGVRIAQGATTYSLAAVAAGSGGISTVGIGGGSPFNDPTFRGGMNEVRIFDGALTPAQITADVNAGPSQLGFTPPYTFAEAARALTIAGGLGSGTTPYELARLNLDASAPATGVDLLDALLLGRKAAGIDANP